MRQLLTAMYLYADDPSNGGFFPTLSRTQDSFAQREPGAGAMQMLYGPYVSDPRIYFCPGDSKKPTTHQLKELEKWPLSATSLLHAKMPIATSYAYDPGHNADTDSRVALIADRPGPNAGNSNNHGKGKGQNVAFGTSSEFREHVDNPLGEGVRDNNIFTLGDTASGGKGAVPRANDSYLRE